MSPALTRAAPPTPASVRTARAPAQAPVAAVRRGAAATMPRGAGAVQARGPSRSAAATSDGVETLGALAPPLEAAIEAGLGSCVTDTDLGLGPATVGKVRDTYDAGDALVIVTTDRLSAFDRRLAAIPFKGRVLNLTSAWWMRRAAAVAPHALLATPHPNVSIMTKCAVFPVEFVVRGFLTGSTDTSLWTHYARGEREYCGNAFPDGMRKNDRLAVNVVTPTTKAADHDEPITPADIVGRGLMTQAQWDEAAATALRLFAFGQAEAAKRGLLLVDTKYELGVDPSTERILVVDEVHTPDSSRYWLADTYAARHAAGQEPQSIDKEFVRLWFRERCDPYADEVLPEAPAGLVAELSRRYISLYQRITGEAFDASPAPDMAAAVAGALVELRARA